MYCPIGSYVKVCLTVAEGSNNFERESFLKTGVTLGYFHSDGKVESVNDKLNSLHKGYLSIDAASLRSLGFNRSGPIALDVSSVTCIP